VVIVDCHVSNLTVKIEADKEECSRKVRCKLGNIVRGGKGREGGRKGERTHYWDLPGWPGVYFADGDAPARRDRALSRRFTPLGVPAFPFA